MRVIISVLNAFRHQRNSHVCLWRNRQQFRGAQRLSASKELSLRCARITFAGKNVLNAFRHQRNSHHVVRSECADCADVLNAFRHQRNSHCHSAPNFDCPAWCSTPFGIKGTLTGMLVSTVRTIWPCSTPFGIKGTLTNSLSPAPIPAGSAQRLSASKELSQCARIESVSRHNVLNAFRHQRNSHRVRGFPAFGADCAQRLSASKELSR